MRLAAKVIDIANENHVLISTAESCTGGRISGALTEVPGASAVVDRGFVAYSNAAKREMLGVLDQTLSAFGAVSEEVAAEMARGALERSDAGLAISVTGIAGPGGSEHKPEGRVCFGIASAGSVITKTVDYGAIGRHEVRAATVNEALRMLLEAINPV